jgi:polar amino acid transport system permease protein
LETVNYIIRISPQLLVGVIGTLQVYFGAIFPALVMGVFFAIVKTAGPKPLRWLLNVYTWAWRGVPLLLQLMIMKYGVLPLLGGGGGDFPGAIWVFALNMAAYLTEIMRAAIGAVDRGQYEACRVLGIPYWRMMFRVIIPQSVRIALPPACSEAINLLKDAAVISVISMQDIVRVTNQITTRDKTVIPYLCAFVIYLILTSLLVKVFGLLEKRFTAYDA